MPSPRFTTQNTVALLIDVQPRLLSVMHNADQVKKQLTLAVDILTRLKVPLLITEQVPDKLGPTDEELSDIATPVTPVVSKTLFSAFTPEIKETLIALGKPQVILMGIEAHVCVTQTALDLLDAGYLVGVLEDAVSSRNALNQAIALKRLYHAHCVPLSVESMAFEMMNDATHPHFKEISKLIR